MGEEGGGGANRFFRFCNKKISRQSLSYLFATIVIVSLSLSTELSVRPRIMEFDKEDSDPALLSPREELEIKRYKTDSLISREKLLECFRICAEIWKDRNRGRFMPFDRDYHDCSSNCSLEPLEFKIFHTDPKLWKEEGSCDKNVAGSIKSPNDEKKIQFLENTHVCVKDMCQRSFGGSPEKSFHFLEVLTFTDLYICPMTGIIHVCGPFCDHMEPNKEGLYVCRLTNKGSLADPYVAPVFHSRYNRLRQDSDLHTNNPFLDMAWNSSFSSRKYGGNNRFHYRNPSKDLDLETAILNSEFISESDILGELGDPTKNKIPASKFCDIKEDYLNFAFVKLLRLFSQDRFDKELESNKRITKTIHDQLEKYTNKTDHLGIEMIATDMYTIATNGRNESSGFPSVHLTQNQRRRFALLYAHKCLAMYVIVRSKTWIGSEEKKKFPFDVFVEAAIQLFQTGFHIKKDAANPYDLVVIEKDDFLDTIPLTDESLTATATSDPGKCNGAIDGSFLISSSCSSSIIGGGGVGGSVLTSATVGENKKNRKKKNKARACVKKNIEEALYGAVIMEGVSPELLKTCDVEYETIDESVFFNNNNNRYHTSREGGDRKRKRVSTTTNNNEIDIGTHNGKSTKEEFLSIVRGRIASK